MSVTVLITGANRGIGLALVEEYLNQAAIVFAGCRHISPELSDLGRRFASMHIVRMDVKDEPSIIQAAADMARLTDHLDIVINNAAVGGGSDATLESLDIGDMLKVLDINVAGPMRVTRAMLAVLKAAKHPRVVNVSSGLGIISTRTSCDSLSYGTSKAALNYVTRSLAFDLHRHNIIVVAMSPGWVRTDMGGPSAPLLPHQSAAGIVKVTAALRTEDSGQWFNHDGTRHEKW